MNTNGIEIKGGRIVNVGDIVTNFGQRAVIVGIIDGFLRVNGLRHDGKKDRRGTWIAKPELCA